MSHKWRFVRYCGLVLPPNENPDPKSIFRVAPVSMFHRMRCYRSDRHLPFWLRRLKIKRANKP